jgi:cobalt-zinc-cadmium efflux system outer membrane protein
MRITRPLLALAALIASSAAGAESLPLATIMARALESAPSISGGEANLTGARAYVGQAGARPNPTIGIDVENFAGPRTLSGLNRAEITVEITQPFELGGQRSARRALAQADVSVAEADRDAARRAVMAETLDAYAQAAAAAARLAIADEQLALAATLAEQTNRRLAAGDVPQIIADRAAVERANRLATRDRAVADRDVATRALAGLIAAPAAVFASADWLQTLASLPPLLRPGLDSLPDAVRWQAVQARAAAALADEKAQRGFDPSVKFGVRQLREIDSTAFVAGVSLPLPFNSRNGGGVARARSGSIRAAYDIEAARRSLARSLDRIVADDAAARANLAVVTGVTLPATARLLALTRRGYTAGALPWRDLADAEQAVAAARLEEIAALETIARTRARMIAITGDIKLAGLVS